MNYEKLGQDYRNKAGKSTATIDNCSALLKKFDQYISENTGLTTFTSIKELIYDGNNLEKLKKYLEREATRSRNHARNSPGALASMVPVILQTCIIELCRDIQAEMIRLALIDGIDLLKINEQYKLEQSKKSEA